MASEETLRLYLVRHGVTDWNREKRWQGHSDTPLNADGRAQATCVAKRLSQVERPPQAVWTSDLSRARDTALAISEEMQIPLFITPLLREMGLGEWEGLQEKDIVARGDAERFRKYRLSPVEHRPPGGETLEHAFKRLHQVLLEIREQHPSGQVAVVGHGGSLRAMFADALEAPIASMLRFQLANCSLSILEDTRTEEGWVRRILLVNDTSHLSA